MLTLEQSKKYHALARILWQREELQRPAHERVDHMGHRGLKEVLRYQAEAKAILEHNNWQLPIFGETVTCAHLSHKPQRGTL